jgi:hypothetical protein
MSGYTDVDEIGRPLPPKGKRYARIDGGLALVCTRGHAKACLVTTPGADWWLCRNCDDEVIFCTYCGSRARQRFGQLERDFPLFDNCTCGTDGNQLERKRAKTMAAERAQIEMDTLAAQLEDSDAAPFGDSSDESEYDPDVGSGSDDEVIGPSECSGSSSSGSESEAGPVAARPTRHRAARRRGLLPADSDSDSEDDDYDDPTRGTKRRQPTASSSEDDSDGERPPARKRRRRSPMVDASDDE